MLGAKCSVMTRRRPRPWPGLVHGPIAGRGAAGIGVAGIGLEALAPRGMGAAASIGWPWLRSQRWPRCTAVPGEAHGKEGRTWGWQARCRDSQGRAKLWNRLVKIKNRIVLFFVVGRRGCGRVGSGVGIVHKKMKVRFLIQLRGVVHPAHQPL